MVNGERVTYHNLIPDSHMAFRGGPSLALHLLRRRTCRPRAICCWWQTQHSVGNLKDRKRYKRGKKSWDWRSHKGWEADIVEDQDEEGMDMGIDIGLRGEEERNGLRGGNQLPRRRRWGGHGGRAIVE